VYDSFKSICDVHFVDDYFRAVEGGSAEEIGESGRCAGMLEVKHLVHITSYDWQLLWNGELGRTLKEPLMNVIFFQSFLVGTVQTGSSTTVLTYVRVHFLASVDYDLSSSLQRQTAVAFPSYHEM
jgi:hypothetical protein